MMRPKLRPTLSRRTKYWGITPTAHRKLNKEARRGSHDLRRLVGHANFLDVLIDELDPNEAEEEQQEQTAVSPVKEEPSPTEEVEELIDDNTESDSEEWSDDEDDEHHSLYRTTSNRPDSRGKNDAYDPIRISPSEDGGDYFQHANHGQVEAISPSSARGYPPNDDKDGAINVTVTNSLLELMDNLGREVEEGSETTPDSPAEQVLMDAKQSVKDAIKTVDLPN